MRDPTCWSDVLACHCQACRALTEIYTTCVALVEPLFVCDCRMYDLPRPWLVADVRRTFIGASPEADRYVSRQGAIDAVLKTQRHCDVFESSWPLMPYGGNDFLWSKERAA